jgi:hypothetical protein
MPWITDRGTFGVVFLMVSRFAWIACFGGTLFCFLVGKPESTRSWRLTEASVAQACELNDSFLGLNQWLDEVEHEGDAKSTADPIVVFENQASLTPADPPQAIFDVPEPIENLRSVFGPTRQGSIRLVAYRGENPDSAAAGEPAKTFWPKPETLLGQIKTLQQIPLARRWSTDTLTILDSIAKASPDSEHLPRLLNQLEHQAQRLPQLAQAVRQHGSISVETVWQQSEISRTDYRLSRRLAVWKALQRSSGNSSSTNNRNPVSNASFRGISFSDVDSRWIEYLKLKEFRDTFAVLNPDPKTQKQVARDILARVYSPVLKPQQAAYVQQVIDPQIISFLKMHASDPVDLSDLMTRIEHYESRCSSLTGFYLNDQYQDLLWSHDPADQAIAIEVQTHYRNANFRCAISGQLLNRLVPVLPTTAQPVSENIKGAQVSGQSHVSNQLHVNLVPDPNRITLQIATQGHVHSDTIAKTNAFRIQNRGNAQFQVVKRISIGRDGIDSSERPQALSSANQFVVGVQSNLDDVPVLGWMARKLAFKKLREQAPETDRIFQQKVSHSAESQMQNQVDKGLAKLKRSTFTNLLQPLLAMDLEPVPMQLATTQQQVVMRYRLAGRDQMAANTARPRDSGSSLMSFQLHQSAVNNMIARIGLNGNKFTIQELAKHLREVVGAPQMESADPPSEQHAEFEFAHFDPIRFDFVEDRLNVTLNLKSLKIGESGKTWKNVSLTAAYHLNATGMMIDLQQDDEGTRIKGKRLRFSDKAAISTIMKVMFKQEYSLNALPAKFNERIGGQDLEVSQFVVSDGWIAVSVDDRRQANRSSLDDHERIGEIRRLMNSRR